MPDVIIHRRTSFRRRLFEVPMAASASFNESLLWSTPLKSLGLTIKGTRLEPILEAFQQELDRIALKVRPHFYLSTEWGVPTGSVAIAIPFYLARPELTELHARHVGHVEGLNRRDILRYLRHEMGHVLNYAYRLFEDARWVELFGSMTQPYHEEYVPAPFSRHFVRHLPGWYAQKHPDEDWAETFAVWMTPGDGWRAEYADWPTARAKLEYCDAIVAELRSRDPVVTTADPDENVEDIPYSLEQYYAQPSLGEGELSISLDSALGTIFEASSDQDAVAPAERMPGAQLIRRHERQLLANVYRWTGHFPERTRILLNALAARADHLCQWYPRDAEADILIRLTTLVTALAMNYVQRGAYFS
jgi:hypothetical protein